MSISGILCDTHLGTTQKGDKMDVRKSNREQTQKFIKSLTSIKSKNPTDSYNKLVRRELKKLGIEMKSERTKLTQMKWHTEYTRTADLLSVSTAKEIIRHYKNAVLSLNLLNHSYKKEMEYLKDEILDALGDSDDVRTLFSYDDLAGIRVALKRLYRANSKKAKGSKAKIALSKIQPEHHAYYKLDGATVMLSKILNDDASDILRKKHDDRIKVNPDYIIALAHGKLTKNTSTWQEMAASLIVVTGRRPTEILKTGTFNKLDEKRVLFDGQLKTRDRGLHESLEAYPIPVLVSSECTADVIVQAMKRVQTLVADTTIEYPDITGATTKSTIGDPKHGKDDIAHNRAVTQYSNRMINDVYSRWIDITGVTCKSMRAMYSQVAYEITKPNLPKGTSEDSYLTSILGYGEHGFGASRNYKQIEIDRTIKKAKAPDACPDRVNDDLIERLKNSTDAVLANRRAKATHILHSILIDMATTGHLTTDEMTAGKLSRIPVNGKRININTVRGYLKTIGIEHETEDENKQ